MEEKSYDIKRSVSLYSYGEEFQEGKLDLEGCIREVSKAGATGIEFLAEQMMWDFPVVTDEFKEKWFHWMKKYAVEPVAYDAFLENHIYDNRALTLREQVDMMTRDLRIAHELGFTVLRTLVSTPMDVLEGSLDAAAKYDVKICLEVHSPFSLNSTWSDGYLNMILKTGTKHFGFMPDMGIFCRHIPDELHNQAKRKGASADAMKMVEDAFDERMEKGFVKIEYDLDLGRANMNYRRANGMDALIEKLQKSGANQAALDYAFSSFAYTWNDPKDIIDNIKYIYHTHAKFYNVTPDYVETAIPIKEVVDAYKKAGYHGYLSSEYEGNQMLNDTDRVDSVEQVRRHQEALRRAIEQ
jgi:sugar phosphate isomerase/epimerase